MSRVVGCCTVALLLSLSSLGAAGSDVADAVMRGDSAAVRALLSKKADVNAKQTDGATALHWAVYREDVATTDLLLQAGANPRVTNSEGFTPLALASLGGNPALIDSLLKAGADPNERLPRGETPLMMASRTGNVAAVRILLDRGADISARETLRGTTAIMWAADQGHAGAVTLLLERGADASVRSNPAPRDRSPARLGKANDPRRQNRALQAAAAGATREEVARLAVREDRNLQAGGQPPRQQGDPNDGGGLTPLVYATRANSLETVKALLEGGVDINQTTEYGWTPLLVATQNRFYQLGSYLLDRGADPNKGNNGAWTPLYLAVDNRNIEGGDYPVRKGDMDHLDFIKKLIDKGADVNARLKDSTESRTVFTNQWLDENGATPFLRAAMSSDLEVMRLLLAQGADPKIATVGDVTALQVAAGIGWVDGLTYEWSEKANVEAVKLLLDLGVDPNVQAETGRTALHGAAHKGRTAVIQMLVDHGTRLDTRDYGMTGNDAGGRFAVHTWQPVDYADGLVRVGVQSAVAHPEAGILLRKLMTERGLEAPVMGRTLASICITEICDVEEPEQQQ
jgi:ankyrin repeat protein